jgi:eukaryotic-like serine/threonine-protein kinase
MPDTSGSARWEQLRALFDQVSELAPDQAAAQLQAIAAEDEALAAELAVLLAAHRQAETGDVMAQALREGLAELDDPGRASGSRAGPYTLQHVLGRGGMGTVYYAVHTETAAIVALKILDPRGRGDHLRERFRREYAILATLDHPHIARFLEAGETTDGALYYAMEFVPGTTLTRYCDTAALPLAARLLLFRHICSAVQHAHARLVLHRDIKPDNILVTPDGTPKLIDFGIARPLRDTTPQTGTQQRFFSPANAAPEQIRGERPGVACDVYQLGTVLYELLCGRAVFDLGQATPGQLERLILEVPPVAPSIAATRTAAQARGRAAARALSQALAGDLDNIVLQALRKSPEERYASVERLADDIDAYLSHRPVSARRGHLLYRLRKFASRHRLGSALAAAALSMIVLLVTALLLQARDLVRERDASDHIARLLIDVFKASDPGVATTPNTRLGDVLEHTRRRLQQGSTDLPPEVEAELAASIADVSLALDQNVAAQSLLEHAAARYAARGGSALRTRIVIAETRARVEGALGNARAAYALSGEVIALRQERGDAPALLRVAQLTQVRALALFAPPSQVIAAYQRLYDVMRVSENDDPVRLARLEVQLAQLLLAERDPQACTLERRAQARLAAVLAARHPDIIWVRAALLACDDETDGGRDPARLQGLQLAYKEQLDVMGERSLPTAPILAWIAAALHRRGRAAEAIATAQDVETLYHTLHGTPRIDNVEMLSALGTYEMADGRVAAAARHIEEAVALAQRLDGPEAPMLPTLRAQLAGAWQRLGRHDEALALLSIAAAAADRGAHAGAGIVLALAEAQAAAGHRTEARSTLAGVMPQLQAALGAFPEWRGRLDSLQQRLHAAPQGTTP